MDGSDVLIDQRPLRVQLLDRDRVLLHERFIAREIESRIRQQRLIAPQVALRRLERRLVRARIDLRNDVALVNQLPFGEQDLLQSAADLRPHRHIGQSRDGADRRNADLNVAGRDGCHGHGDGRVLTAAACRIAARSPARRRRVAHGHEDDQAEDVDEQEREERAPVPALDVTHRLIRRQGNTISAFVHRMLTMGSRPATAHYHKAQIGKCTACTAGGAAGPGAKFGNRVATTVMKRQDFAAFHRDGSARIRQVLVILSVIFQESGWKTT